MYKNYLKTAFRNLFRNKIYSVINLLGLSVGITCALLLYLYVQDEMSYDRHYAQSQQIYRYTTQWSFGGEIEHSTNSSGRLAWAVKQQFPEIENVLRVQSQGRQLVEHNQKFFNFYSFQYVDSTCFQFFDYQFVEGNPENALKNPDQVVLTEKVAKKIFGKSKGVVGKTFLLNDRHTVKVTGVIADPTKNSHLRVNAFVSIATLDKDEATLDKWNSYGNCTTYLLLKEQTSVAQLAEQTSKWFHKVAVKDNDVKIATHLQPLTKVHLHSRAMVGEQHRGNIKQVYALLLIIVFVLLIAAINYINLATSRSLQRAKEVGIRKVMGSYRSQLVGQFLAESFLMVIASLILSLSLAELLLPSFNKLIIKDLFIHYQDVQFWVILTSFILFMGLLSGFYPAFVLSSFRPVQVLKGKMLRQPGSTRLRKALVVFQFSISIVFIVGTLIVYQQLNFMRKQDLGFTKAQVIDFSLPKSLSKKAPQLKQALLQNTDVLQVTATSTSLGRQDVATSSASFFYNNQNKKEVQTQVISVDEDYQKTLQLKLKEGRWFSKQYKSDAERYVVINETMAKKIGAKDISKVKMVWGDSDKPFKILGVVKDFHQRSLHVSVNPMIMVLNNGDPRHLFIKAKGNALKSTMALVKQLHTQYEKKNALRAQFLDQYFDRQYRKDERQGKVFFMFSGMAIFIACLGLLGLAAFMVQQRTKEMGIRKVLGASAFNIIWLITKSFVGLIAIASLIAFPVGYYAMKQWLQGFAYQTTIHWSVFVLVGVVAVGIAVLTISWQALRAAAVNPVKVLKDE